MVNGAMGGQEGAWRKKGVGWKHPWERVALNGLFSNVVAFL